MTDRLEFGSIKFEMVNAYTPGIGVFNKAYILYDGRTAIAMTSAFMRRPKVSGICEEGDIATITGEIGNKQDLWVRTEVTNFKWENSAIIGVDIKYWKRAEGKNYYNFTLNFAVEGAV